MNRYPKGLTLLMAVLLLLMPMMTVWAADAPLSDDTEGASKATLPQADLSHAENVLLYCIETDTILRTKNAEAAIQPVNGVKLMTAILAFERIDDLKAEITVTQEMVKGVSGTY